MGASLLKELRHPFIDARPRSCFVPHLQREGPLGNDGTLRGPMNKAPHPLVNRPRTVVTRARLETRYSTNLRFGLRCLFTYI